MSLFGEGKTVSELKISQNETIFIRNKQGLSASDIEQKHNETQV